MATLPAFFIMVYKDVLSVILFCTIERFDMDYKYSNIYKTVNKDRYRSANPFYYHIRTKSPQKDYLFTEKELKKAADRAYSNLEDLPKARFTEGSKSFACFMMGCTASVLVLLTVEFGFYLMNK